MEARLLHALKLFYDDTYGEHVDLKQKFWDSRHSSKAVSHFSFQVFYIDIEKVYENYFVSLIKTIKDIANSCKYRGEIYDKKIILML